MPLAVFGQVPARARDCRALVAVLSNDCSELRRQGRGRAGHEYRRSRAGIGRAAGVLRVRAQCRGARPRGRSGPGQDNAVGGRDRRRAAAPPPGALGQAERCGGAPASTTRRPPASCRSSFRARPTASGTAWCARPIGPIFGATQAPSRSSRSSSTRTRPGRTPSISAAAAAPRAASSAGRPSSTSATAR